VTACSELAPGFAHCHAETVSLRFGWNTRRWLPGYAPENLRVSGEVGNCSG